MATKATLQYGGQLIGHNFHPAYQLYRFTPHRHRVLNLYKKCWRTLKAHDTDQSTMTMFGVDATYCFERTVMRARFDENKHVTSLAKATELLKGIY
jgi:NADH dehydrogenase (ubiquinone) 1 beta subcomplex subunit 9